MKAAPHMKAPCQECPFRKDALRGWLGDDRVKDIANQESFICHKTIHTSDSRDKRQCAGHMILRGESNDYVRLAKILGVNLCLKNKELVFDSIEDMALHHA